MSATPEIRITTAGHSGECQECGRIDHSGPLALVHKRVPGPRGYTDETFVGECCQPRLIAEYRGRDERGEIRLSDLRETGPDLPDWKRV